ncbi:MAG: hypothetical protein ACRDWI_04035 [Jiangellaceae bacterium]
MSEHTEQQAPQPSTKVRNLDRLVGTWTMSGGVQGTVRYEWMEGGFFLLQHVSIDHDGHQIRGMEVIGHEQRFGEEPSEDVKSRFYDSEGNTLDYVYEIEGDTFTIWGGEKGSPAYARSTFSEDGNSASGAWVFPGDGGYEFTMTRVTS